MKTEKLAAGRWRTPLVLFALGASAATVARAGYIPTMEKRPGLSLDCERRTILDPCSVGHSDRRWKPRDAAARPSRDAFFVLLEYYRDKARQIRDGR